MNFGDGKTFGFIVWIILIPEIMSLIGFEFGLGIWFEFGDGYDISNPDQTPFHP